MRVRDKLRKAWEKDAVQALRAANTDVFRRYIQDESDRIAEAWMESCTPRIGESVEASELACLDGAEGIDEVIQCGR